MRCALFVPAAAAALSLAAPAPAQPGYPPQGQGYANTLAVVDYWYQAYLGRRAVDDPMSRFWTDQFQAGIASDVVEAGILGSDEYYRRAGNTPDGWVRAVYRDALQRQATPREVNYWVRRAYSQRLVPVATEILAQRPAANNSPYPGQQYQNQPQQPPGQNWGWGRQQPQEFDYRRPYYPYRQ